MLHKALQVAMNAHQGQNRKSLGMPYIVHPIRVADKVSRFRNDVMTAAALCHDTIEESFNRVNTIDELKKVSLDVYKLVDELTFSGDDKKAYIASFRSKSIESLIIKLIDREDNIKDFLKFDREYAKVYAAKAYPLVDIMMSRGDELEKFDAKLDKMMYSICGFISGDLV